MRQPIIVDDLDDPRIADYLDAAQPDRLRSRGLFVAEGRQVARRLLQSSSFTTRSLLVSTPALESLRDVLDTHAGDWPIFLCTLDQMRALVGFNIHRGCLAIGERPRLTSADALLAASPPRATVVVLEQIGNPDNMGGLFRNARAFGAHAVFLSPGCSDPLYRKAIRVSMGAVLDQPFSVIDEWPAFLGALSARGFAVCALSPHGDAVDIESPSAALSSDRLALVLGAEGPGLSEGALAAADVHVRIPMTCGVDSLNVVVACGIALHRLTRERTPRA